MFVEGLVKVLSADATVQSLIGNPARVWANIAPDEPLMPYVVYTTIHSEPVISYDGTNPTTEYRFQFSCSAASYKLAKNVSNAIKNVLDGFIGAIGDPDNVVLEQSIKLSEHDEIERELKATTYTIVLDYHFIVNSPK